MPPTKTIYDLGFDRLLNKGLNSVSTGLVYDPVGSSLNIAQILSGGALTLKSLSIGGLIRQVAPGDDIQAAIDAVNREGGGTVQLLAGTYLTKNNIELKSNVSLVGSGIGSTIVDFGGQTYNLRVTGTARTVGGTGVTITEGSTTVTGVGGTTFLTNIASGDIVFITSTASGGWGEVSSIESDTSLTLKKAWPYPTVTNFAVRIFKPNNNCIVKNLTTTNSSISTANTGVLNVDRAINFLAENVLSTNNSAAEGIFVDTVLNSEFRNVESSYNGNDSTDNGFTLLRIKRVSLYSCSALGNAGNGFDVDVNTVSEGNAFYSCFAEGNTRDGFELNGTAGLYSCRSMGNDQAGFNLLGDFNLLSGCSAIDNGIDGIETASGGDFNVIDGCLLKNNDAFGIDILSGSVGTKIINTDFSDNASGTVRDAGSRTNYHNQGGVQFTAVNWANNNIDVAENRFVRIVGPTAAFSISGIAAPVNGKTVILYNSVAFDMTITNDATSTLANRILTLTGADVVLTGVSSATFIYNLIDARWILVGSSG